MDDHYSLPEPLGAAIHFIERTNDARSTGIEIDSAQVLAAKVACVAVREYFARLATAVESGIYDPMLVPIDKCVIDGWDEEEEGQTEAE